ncbi:MAG: FlgD immunoglobulin-like domain containing protein [Candidatus Eiseniibacteriota bacterium]
MRRPRLALLLLALSLYATTARADFGRDPYTPVLIAPTSFGPTYGTAVADGSGGMFVTWDDSHGGTRDVYLQRLTARGALSPGWPVGGLRVCSASGTQDNPRLANDGAGGVFVTWDDTRGATQDIYAARVQGDGTLAPGWPATGVLLSTSVSSAADADYQPAMVADGAGGAFVAWTLQFSSQDVDVYGARVNAAGTVLWSSLLYAPSGAQLIRKIIGDGAGGFWTGFNDNETNGSGVYKAKVQRFNSAGVAQFSPVPIGTNSQTYGMDIASDGGTGVYGVCTDNGPVSFSNIAANHFLANGSNDPNWAGYKFVAYQLNHDQGIPVAVADGSGGLLVAFYDWRYGSANLFAQRIGAYGVPWNGWPVGGVALSTVTAGQLAQTIVSDGAGGAIVSFLDNRLGLDYFVYATRVLGNGSTAPGWAYGGTPVELGGLKLYGFPVVSTVSDGNGGAIFGWMDTRNTSSAGYAGVYAQNIDAWGQYGDARPLITKIADIPGDQGGEISLQWSASYLDANPSRTVTQYSVWRRVPGGTASAQPSAAARAAAARDSRPALRATPDGVQVIYWEYVETDPARMLPGYSAVIATTSDSTGALNAKTSYMIDAESPDGQMFWASPPDSGYSVDNIPPYAPAPFTGTYSAGVASLHWSPVMVADLDNYRLYRGSSAGFIPSESNHIASPTDTSFSDAIGAPYFYRLTAVDLHGNESASTLLLPVGALAVDNSLPGELSFAPPTPNPARGLTQLRYALPRAANVRLAIYDLGGRRVRTLAEGSQAAGNHSVAWDVRDDQGHALGAGLYFARFEAEGRVFMRRVVTMR